MLIHRLPREESVIFPQSHCPHCKKNIAWFDNIPIISFIMLGGKCRSCKNNISPRYIFIEILTGLFFSLLSTYYGFNELGFYAFAFFISSLIAASFSDIEHGIIPDELIFIGIPAGFLFNYFSNNLASSIIGCLAGFLSLYLIGQIGKFAYKKEALGFGDVKLAALMGAWLLPDKLLLALFLGYALAAVWVVFLMVFKIKKFGDTIPFGPGLSIGAIISLFWGGAIINFYLARCFN